MNSATLIHWRAATARSIPGTLMSDRIAIRVGSTVHRIRPLSYLAAEALDGTNSATLLSVSTTRMTTVPRAFDCPAGQADGKFGELANSTLDFDHPAMLLGDDVIGD
jgi:hypothetical protein